MSYSEVGNDRLRQKEIIGRDRGETTWELEEQLSRGWCGQSSGRLEGVEGDKNRGHTGIVLIISVPEIHSQ